VLLLVLILVLIAFALLVVSLLTGSVLSAWVSVGVSVAAAAVLLVDWLQRRSALRAGAEAGEAASLPAAAPVPPPPVDHVGPDEPATEVLPVVPPGPAGPAGDAAAVTDSRHGERHDTRETVVMRAFTPPGSADQPPGATGGIGPADPESSHSVTFAGGSHRGSGPSGGPGNGPQDGSGAPSAAAPDTETTVQVPGAVGRDPATRDEPAAGAWSGVPDAGPPPGSSVPGAQPPGAAARQDLPPLGPDGAPPEEPLDPEAAGLVAVLDDEVLVVDELPRYHLDGCRSLTGIPVIPLPAREAVELGFTPCAWCTPDRTLATRRRTPVQ
jgi:hypothetical protein